VRNLAAGGALVALMLGSSIVIQLLLINSSNFFLQIIGLCVAIIGVMAVVAAWHLSSFFLMIAGSISSGVAIGMCYLGSISEINRLAAPAERGSVNSLYFVIVYLFFSIPTITLGFLATHLGLYNAVFAFATVIVLVAVSSMVWLAIRQRSAA